MPQGASELRCIYCNSLDLNEEHWLPRLFGSFGYEPLKNHVCTSCNTALGAALDERLAVTGPGSIVRTVAGITGRHRASTDPIYFEAASDPATKLM